MKRRGVSKREPTIALINIVFLMLIFFMVAGTLAPPLDPDLSLVTTADLDGRAPPDALVLRKDGSLSLRGTLLEEGAKISLSEPSVRLVPDRDVPAIRLVEVVAQIKAAGAEEVLIVTENALK